MSFKQSHSLSQQHSLETGRWRDPARLYQAGSSRLDESSSSDQSESNELSDSTLDGIDVGSSQSRSAVNSMMYSDDEFSTKSGFSLSSNVTKSKVVGDDSPGYESLPLFTNADMMQVYHQSQGMRIQDGEIQNTSGSVCDTLRSSIASTVHDDYFNPSRAGMVTGNDAMLVKSIVADTSVDSDSENYIFTDDEYDDGIQLVAKDTVDASLNTNEKASSSSVSLEQDWSSLQQRRGRLLAQQLLENVSNRKRTNTAQSSTSSSLAGFDESEVESDDSNRAGKRSSFFARTLQSIRKRVTNEKKKFSMSSSPLDKLRIRRSWTTLDDINPTNVPTRPAAPLAPIKVATSAASTRNYLSDFSSWETYAHTMSYSDILSSLAEDVTEDCSTILEETSFSCETREDPFQLNHLLQSQFDSFDFREGVEDLSVNDEMIVFRSSFENSRASPDDVAEMIGIEQEGTAILQKARLLHRTNNSCCERSENEQERDETMIPMVRITDDVWLSNYDEYVSRTKSAFYNRLPNVLGQHVSLLLDE